MLDLVVKLVDGVLLLRELGGELHAVLDLRFSGAGGLELLELGVKKGGGEIGGGYTVDEGLAGGVGGGLGGGGNLGALAGEEEGFLLSSGGEELG